MATKAEKAEAAAEARADEKAERLAEDKAAVEEQAATVVVENAPGTSTRQGVGGFVEVVNATGDVISRHEQGAPAPD
jgi:hypothetical protein